MNIDMLMIILGLAVIGGTLYIESDKLLISLPVILHLSLGRSIQANWGWIYIQMPFI